MNDKNLNGIQHSVYDTITSFSWYCTDIELIKIYDKCMK